MQVFEHGTDESSPTKTDRAIIVSEDLNSLFAACAG